MFDSWSTYVALRGFKLLKGVPKEYLNAVADDSSWLEAKTGRLERGGEGEVYFVVDGSIGVYRDQGLVRQVGPGETFGKLSAFSDDHLLEYRVENPARLVVVPARSFRQMIEEHFVPIVEALAEVSQNVILERMRLGPAAGFSCRPNQTRLDDLDLADAADRIVFLHRALVLDQSGADAVARLALRSKVRRYPEGTVIWSEGQASDVFQVAFDGRIHCERADQTFTFHPADVFGSLELWAESCRWYTAKAEAEVRCLEVHRDDLFDVFEDRPEALWQLLQHLSTLLLDFKAKNLRWI
jgi:CRP-like cAMP-binding protein